MRLWTFQSRDFIREIMTRDWHLYSNTHGSVNKRDEGLITTTKIARSGRLIDVYELPIYCIARVKEKDMPLLSLEAFLLQYNYFINYSRINILNGVMVELEVPDSNIILMRKSEDIETRSNYLEFVRNAEEVVEAIISYIPIGYVVSYKTFHQSFGFTGFEVRTEVVNDILNPAWTETVYLSEDQGIYGADGVGSINKLEDMTMHELICRYGMKEAPDYYYVTEVLKTCCREEQDRIIGLCNRFGIFKDSYNQVTVEYLRQRLESSKRIDQLFESIK